MKKDKNLTKKDKRGKISFRRKLSISLKRLIFLLKILFVALILTLLFTDIFDIYTDKIKSKSYQYLANYGFVLKNIIIEGKEHTPYKDIIDSLHADKGDPIFSVDIRAIKERLESATWIKTAVIERRLPSTIYIEVAEREPIAIWQFKQKLYIVDSEGNRITKYNGEGFIDLLHVVGPDANIYANSLLSSLEAHPILAKKIISAVRYGNRRWNLNLDQDIIVKMPEKHFDEAYDYLYSLFKNNKLFDQGYKVLDLRDSDKYYIEMN